MSKRHTASRSFTEKPRMVWIMISGEANPADFFGWHRVTEKDAEIFAEVLRAEKKDFVIMTGR
jgi:hypothetical protein